MNTRQIGAGNAPKVRYPKPQHKNKHHKIELSGGDEGKQKEWLIIYYGAGDNNLTDYLYSDLNEVEAVGSDENTHIVALFDAGVKSTGQAQQSQQNQQNQQAQQTGNQQSPRREGHSTVKNPPYQVPAEFEGAKIFYLKPDKDRRKVNSPVIADLGQVNTADPDFMADVISAIIKKYPAKHVAIIVSDHGGGWLGAIEDEHPKETFMNLKNIKKMAEKVHKRLGRKIDLLGWDACLMASAEVVTALAPHVKIMVASEESEGGDGWPYPNIFAKTAIKNIQSTLRQKIDATPEELAQMIVHGASTSPDQIETLAAIKTTNVRRAKTLMKLVDDFSLAVLKAIEKDPSMKQKLQSLYRQTEDFGGWYFDFIDVFDFARRVAQSKDITDKELKKRAEELFNYRKKIIIANFRNESKHPHAYGLQAEGSSRMVKKESYKDTDWAKNTHWDEMIALIGSYGKDENEKPKPKPKV